MTVRGQRVRCVYDKRYVLNVRFVLRFANVKPEREWAWEVDATDEFDQCHGFCRRIRVVLVGASNGGGDFNQICFSNRILNSHHSPERRWHWKHIQLTLCFDFVQFVQVGWWAGCNREGLTDNFPSPVFTSYPSRISIER